MVSSNTSRSNLIIYSQLKTTKNFRSLLLLWWWRSVLSCPKAAICCRQVISNCFFKSFFFCITLCVIAGVIGTSYLRDYLWFISRQCSTSFPGFFPSREKPWERGCKVFTISKAFVVGNAVWGVVSLCHMGASKQIKLTMRWISALTRQNQIFAFRWQ